MRAGEAVRSASKRSDRAGGRRQARGGGFTLVELVLALAVLGFALTYLVFLRLDAVKRVTTVCEEREVRRIVQEVLEQKLAEFLSGELEDIAGELPDRRGWTWEWVDPLDPANLIQEGDEFVLSCTVRVAYPNPDDPDGPPRTEEMSTWILPTEEQLDFILEQQEYMAEFEDAYGWGTEGESYVY